MALSPSDVTKARAAKLTATRKKALERDVDCMLKDAFGVLSTCALSVDDLSKDEIEYIKKTYDAAGWKVSYVNDARDGDYLDFKPKR